MHLRSLIVVALMLLIGAVRAAEPKTVESKLRQMVGARCRFIWTQGADGEKHGTMYTGDGAELWVLDTDDGQGAQRIGTKDSYQRPLLTGDGKRIVFTDYPERKIEVINFDGSGRRVLVEGAQMGDVWRDPKTGEDWVYYRELVEGKPKREAHLYEGGKLWRCKLDDPATKELIWDKTGVCHGSLFYLSLTDDGKYAASAWPWAANGVAQFPNVAYQQWHFGCWSGLAPDNSGRFFSFDGDHQYLHMFDWGGVNERKIEFKGMPNYERGEVYYPRWSNHPDFLVISYLGNTYLAKFNEGVTAIEKYVTVVSCDVNGWLGYPDCWIDRGPDFKVAGTDNLRSLDFVPDTGKDWPGSRDGLAFLWKNRKTQNTVSVGGGKTAQIDLDARGYANFGRDWQMRFVDGAFVPKSDETAKRIVSAVKKTKAMTLEFTALPRESRQDGTIMVLHGADGKVNFRLSQWLNRLELWFPRTVTKKKKGKVQPNKMYSLPRPRSSGTHATHVIFSYTSANGKLDVYMDGQYVNTRFMGAFHAWDKDDFGAWDDDAKLIFGRQADGSDPWKGELEGVSIYNRALSAAEAKQHYQLYRKYLKGRTEPKRIQVQAKLIEATPIPQEQDLDIYSRALVANEYEVQNVKDGKLSDKRIIVQQWAVMDRKQLPETRNWEVGKTFTLSIERIADHPELEGERLFNELENLEANAFLEVPE